MWFPFTKGLKTRSFWNLGPFSIPVLVFWHLFICSLVSELTRSSWAVDGIVKRDIQMKDVFTACHVCAQTPYCCLFLKRAILVQNCESFWLRHLAPWEGRNRVHFLYTKNKFNTQYVEIFYSFLMQYNRLILIASFDWLQLRTSST